MKNISKIILGISLFTNGTLFAMKEHTTPYQHLQINNEYHAILSSKKILTIGKNNLDIKILKNNNFVKNADVNIIFTSPTMLNIEFAEHAKETQEKYNLNATFKVKGKWQYELMFKTNYGKIYSTEGRVTIN